MKMERIRLLILLLLISALSGWVAIGSDSLWIDEGNAAAKAMLPSWNQWTAAMRAERGSDAQMPLYMAWLWAWEKGFGHGEQALRMANLPWLLLGNAVLFAAILRSRRGPGVAVFCALGAAVSPFLWYYLNEARPYVMQYSGACLALAYLLEAETAPERAFKPWPLWTGVLGVMVLTGSSLLGLPWAGAAFLALCWILWGSVKEGRRIAWPPPGSFAMLGLLAVVMAGLGFYYLETLKAGAGASGVAKTNLVTMAFAGYEIAGLAGLGPNRAALRDGGVGALSPYALRLAAGCLAIFAAAAAGYALRVRQTGRKLPPGWMLLALALPAAFLFALGIVSHFRLLGRHLMPAFPLLLLLAALALDSLMRSRLLRVLAVFVLAAWTASSLLLRFSPVHRRDNYRDAAALAQNALAAGQRVWWAADQPTGHYYGLDFKGQARLTLLANAYAGTLANEPEPDLVCLSKRDIYDAQGALAEYLSARGYVPKARLTAFTVFEKRP